MRRTKTISVSGILLFLLTIVLFFLLTNDRILITWLGFGFMLFAELVFFGGLILIETASANLSQITARAGGYVVLSIYSVIVSLVFMLIKPETASVFWSIQSVLLVIAGILLLVIMTSAKSIHEKDIKVLNSLKKVGAISERLTLLMEDDGNSKYKKILYKAVENLKYSDTSTVLSSDDEIEGKITQLELELVKEDYDHKDTAVEALIQELINLISRRRAHVKNSKAGSL